MPLELDFYDISKKAKQQAWKQFAIGDGRISWTPPDPEKEIVYSFMPEKMFGEVFRLWINEMIDNGLKGANRPKPPKPRAVKAKPKVRPKKTKPVQEFPVEEPFQKGSISAHVYEFLKAHPREVYQIGELAAEIEKTKGQVSDAAKVFMKHPLVQRYRQGNTYFYSWDSKAAKELLDAS
jgi:hypothetical protein